MLKKLIVGLVLLVSASFILWTSISYISDDTNRDSSQDVLGDSPDLSEDDPNTAVIEHKGITYIVTSTRSIKGEDIFLGLNLNTKEIASEIYSENNCEILVNGGFYDTDDTPIGLFIENGEVKGRYERNSLFDAIFSINYFDTPRITRTHPQDELKYAVQTGPLLIENAQILKLSLQRDKNARRNIAAVLGTNEVVFLSVFNLNNKYEGPLLADLPDILELWMEQTNINLADALNLDGGSASAFLTPTTRLSEISPIGSYFCVR